MTDDLKNEAFTYFEQINALCELIIETNNTNIKNIFTIQDLCDNALSLFK